MCLAWLQSNTDNYFYHISNHHRIQAPGDEDSGNGEQAGAGDDNAIQAGHTDIQVKI